MSFEFGDGRVLGRCAGWSFTRGGADGEGPEGRGEVDRNGRKLDRTDSVAMHAFSSSRRLLEPHIGISPAALDPAREAHLYGMRWGGCGEEERRWPRRGAGCPSGKASPLLESKTERKDKSAILGSYMAQSSRLRLHALHLAVTRSPCALRTPLHSFAARQRTLLSRRQHPYLGLWRYAWEDAVISRTSGRALILLAGPPSQRGDSGYAKTTSRACVHLAGEHARFSNTVPRASWDDLSSWHGGSGALWPTSSSSGTLQEVGASAAGRDA